MLFYNRNIHFEFFFICWSISYKTFCHQATPWKHRIWLLAWSFREGLLTVPTPCKVHECGQDGDRSQWWPSALWEIPLWETHESPTLLAFCKQVKNTLFHFAFTEMIGIGKSNLLTLLTLKFVLCGTYYLEVESWGSNLGWLLLR